MAAAAVDIKKLESMGFSTADSQTALVKHGGNLTQALNELVAADPLAAAVGGAAAGADAAAAPQSEPEPETPSEAARSCFSSDDTVERLQIRLEHQHATLEMLRAAGATEEELKVLLRDVAALEERISSLREQAKQMAAAQAAAEQKQKQMLWQQQQHQ